MEVERVTPLLKVHIVNDNKDWRLHQEQMKQQCKVVSQFTKYETLIDSFSVTKEALDNQREEIDKILEKISSREKYMNGNFEEQVHDDTHWDSLERIASC
jgi:estrogen-related receptor beta like 1